MATSGTVSQTVFETRKVIDHAFRRCKLVPQQITSEMLETAMDCLYLVLSTLVNQGVKTWAQEKIILGLHQGEMSVVCPPGTVDILNLNIRTGNRLIGTPFGTVGFYPVEYAFDEDVNTYYSEFFGNTILGTMLDVPARVTTIGILPRLFVNGNTETWNFSIQAQRVGGPWEFFKTWADYTLVDEEWLYLDFEGKDEFIGYRLVADANTAFFIAELVFMNNTREITMAKVNRDNYSTLPDKNFQGRPTQFWYNKSLPEPTVTIWPTPNGEYEFAQLVGYSQRQIQDVGSLTQTLDIPQRWYMAVVAMLAESLARETKDVDMQLIPLLEANMEKEVAKAWRSESDGSDSMLTPGIGVYTA
jgi:hypothetical protein